MLHRCRRWLGIGSICFCSTLLTGAAPEYHLDIRLADRNDTRRLNCIEPATFIAAAELDGQPAADGEIRFHLTNDGGPVLHRRDTRLADGPAEVTYTLSAPGFLRCVAEWYIDDRCVAKAIAAAAYEPEKIRQAFPEPEDFDVFWQQSFEQLAAVPPDWQIAPYPAGSDEQFDCFLVNAANVNGKRIYGVLTVPAKEGKFPAVACVPGAGNASNATYFRFPDTISLFLNVHEYEPSDDPAENKARHDAAYAGRYLPEIAYYTCIGVTDREKFFFRDAYLGMSRLLDVIRNHPKYDGKNLGICGSSQGGAALALAALNPDIAMVVTGVPSFCDLGAGVAGRAPGGPQLLRSAQPGRWVRIIPATSYCDTANFARRVHCPTTVIVGWVDVASVPASVYAAYNNLPGKMKRIIDMPTMGHGNPPEYTAAIAEMIEKLHR